MKMYGTVAKLLEEEMTEKGRSKASEEKLIAVSGKGHFLHNITRDSFPLPHLVT